MRMCRRFDNGSRPDIVAASATGRRRGVVRLARGGEIYWVSGLFDSSATMRSMSPDCIPPNLARLISLRHRVSTYNQKVNPPPGDWLESILRRSSALG